MKLTMKTDRTHDRKNKEDNCKNNGVKSLRTNETKMDRLLLKRRSESEKKGDKK